MSTLTKIFIVLMVIFSIAFTVMTISIVAKTNDWRQLAEDYKAEQLLVETSMRNLAASHAAEKAVWLDARQDLNARIGSLEEKEAGLYAEVAEARDEIARLRAEKGNADAVLAGLQSSLQVAQSGWLEQRDLRGELERRNLELERRNLDLSERVNEQTAQILVLVQQQRQFEQQINILREENTKVAGGAPAGTPSTAGLGAVRPVTAPAATPIRGQIVEVQGKLATISVGTADGVQPGMVFVIYRGSDYVGDIEITDVEPSLAAGRIIRSRSTPRPSDMVADEPALGLAQ